MDQGIFLVMRERRQVGEPVHPELESKALWSRQGLCRCLPTGPTDTGDEQVRARQLIGQPPGPERLLSVRVSGPGRPPVPAQAMDKDDVSDGIVAVRVDEVQVAHPQPFVRRAAGVSKTGETP